jgi:hypothetical protein
VAAWDIQSGNSQGKCEFNPAAELKIIVKAAPKARRTLVRSNRSARIASGDGICAPLINSTISNISSAFHIDHSLLDSYCDKTLERDPGEVKSRKAHCILESFRCVSFLRMALCFF